MADLGVLAHQVEQLIGEAQRVAVMQADPLEAVDVSQCLHQLHDMRLAVNVVAVIGQVLGDEDELLHALLGQTSRLFDEVVHRHGYMAATDERDGTESATAVAAFGDLEISVMLRGGKHTAAAIVGLHLLFQQVGSDEIDTLHTIEGVHLVDFGLQVLLEPLREASRDIQLLDLALLTQLGIFQDGVDGLLLRITDEATGVDDDHIGTTFVVVTDHIAVFQQSGQMLRVDFVLGATEGDDI
ncbi:MAG: hypothetical protein IKR05_11255 [Prevotella sp.]|nr:hypothetical protein [Prevotella sp.]